MNNSKIECITSKTLIVGVDIAKRVQWAKFTDFRGLEVSKHLKFENNLAGFKSIIQKIEEIKVNNKFNTVIVGMEPTGHYWKPLASFLEASNIKVVLVNPAHTKKSKELDDNSQTKNDKKDALTIARLVKDGRYLEMYLPKEEYGELRALTLTRIEVIKNQNITKNRIRAIMDEYFPEFETVFKSFVQGKTAVALLKSCPFPEDILSLGETEVLEIVKSAVKKSVGKKKVKELLNAAKESVGVCSGLSGARIRLAILIDNFEQNKKHLELLEKEMESQLKSTGYFESLTSIDGVGVVSSASFLGEIGDPKRFSHPQQIIRLAGFNLVENSSGDHKSKTGISKRGRKKLRAILYNMALVLVSKNDEMKSLYNYLKTRKNNPLKKKQALIVIAEKIVRVMFYLMKNEEEYNKTKVLGEYRLAQMAA